MAGDMAARHSLLDFRLLWTGQLTSTIGSACSEVKDAQGMMMPAMILAMMPIFLWLQVAQNPDSAMSVGFSLFRTVADQPFRQLVDAQDAGPTLASELLAFCRERLADFKCPRSIDFDPALPRLPTGKLYKKLVKQRYWPQ